MDYCCLNYKLPSACEGKIQCVLKRNKSKAYKITVTNDRRSYRNLYRFPKSEAEPLPEDGFHEYIFLNGDRYIGEWSKSLAHGKGTRTYNHDGRFEGNWINGRRSGYGIFYFDNGDIYKGNWENDKKHGIGVIIDSNGNENHVEYEDGKLK